MKSTGFNGWVCVTHLWFGHFKQRLLSGSTCMIFNDPLFHFNWWSNQNTGVRAYQFEAVLQQGIFSPLYLQGGEVLPHEGTLQLLLRRRSHTWTLQAPDPQPGCGILLVPIQVEGVLTLHLDGDQEVSPCFIFTSVNSHGTNRTQTHEKKVSVELNP